MKQTPRTNPYPALIARLVIAMLFIGAIGSLSAQEIISFTVESGVAGTTRNWMWQADLAGAPGVRTNNWNNIGNWVNGGSGNADAALLPGTVTNSAGLLLPNVGAVFHNSSGGGYTDRGAGTTNDLKMYMDVADGYNESSLAGYGYLYVTNIPYTNYNVYVYFLPDNGSGSTATRGGVFCITNAPTGTNCVYMKNQSNDVAMTQLPVPTTTTFASAYVQSTTTSIGSGGVAWTSIQGGNYGVLYGLTNANCKIMFAGLGNGSGAVDPFGNYVNGGSTAVRFKVAGFQIYQVPSATPTNLYLQNSSPVLHAGDPSGTQVTVLANLSDGTVGVAETPNCTFSSDNTNVVTVSASGLLKPGTNGTANLIVNLASAGLSLTNPVTVLAPTSVAISVGSTNLLVGNNKGDTTATTLTANYSDAANVPVNNYAFVTFSTIPSGIITAATNGTLTAVAVGSAQVVGTYDGLSVTSSVMNVSSYTAPGSVAAFSINLTDASDPITFHDLSGAPGARAAYWNNMVMSFGTVTNEIDNPLDFHGNILTNTVVQVLPNNTTQQAILVQGTRTTNESVMFNTMFDQGAGNGASAHSYIVVSNVPYASYDAYFYFYNDATQTNRVGQVTINGVTQYRNNGYTYPATPANDGTGYVQAIQPGSTPTSVTQVPYGNYIKFAGLTSSTLNVDWGAVGQDVFLDAAAVTRVRLAGFQIVQSLGGLTATNIYLQSAVPAQLPGNPTTYPLTVFADFSDGTTGGNITALPGINFSSSDPNVFTVDANGVITPGLTPGIATLTITYQTNTQNVSVTNLAPVSMQPLASPDTIYSDSVLGLVNSQARLFATFNGNSNVDVTAFGGISFAGNNDPVATVSTSGAITPTGTTGVVGIIATYAGVSATNLAAFTVATNGSTFLKHRYSFRDAANSTLVLDSAGSANGTIFPALSGYQNITLDGERANFPGDSAYTTAPYIALPPNLVSVMGDVTFDFWFTVRTNADWARIFDLGASGKGTDPHASGSGSNTSGMEFTPKPGGGSTPRFEIRTPSGSLFMVGTISLPVGVEHHVTLVYSPNQNIAKMYLDGVLNVSSNAISGGTLGTITENNTWLGVSQWNDPTLNGAINEFRVYEGAFSDAQVTASQAAGASVGLVSTVPTNIVFSALGNTLNLSWPADHLGWKLQAQTNSLGNGLGTNWVTILGSDSVTSTNVIINPTNGSVFYRLIY